MDEDAQGRIQMGFGGFGQTPLGAKDYTSCVLIWAWSSTDFWPAEPLLTKILASRVVLNGALIHLGNI